MQTLEETYWRKGPAFVYSLKSALETWTISPKSKYSLHPRTISGNPDHEPTEDLVQSPTRLLDCLRCNMAAVAATIRDVPEDLGLANIRDISAVLVKELLTHSYTYLTLLVIYIDIQSEGQCSAWKGTQDPWTHDVLWQRVWRAHPCPQ